MAVDRLIARQMVYALKRRLLDTLDKSVAAVCLLAWSPICTRASGAQRTASVPRSPARHNGTATGRADAEAWQVLRAYWSTVSAATSPSRAPPLAQSVEEPRSRRISIVMAAPNATRAIPTAASRAALAPVRGTSGCRMRSCTRARVEADGRLTRGARPAAEEDEGKG
jgi:hypothetical protein